MDMLSSVPIDAIDMPYRVLVQFDTSFRCRAWWIVTATLHENPRLIIALTMAAFRLPLFLDVYVWSPRASDLTSSNRLSLASYLTL